MNREGQELDAGAGRGVSPATAVLLMSAVTIIIAAVIGAFVLGIGGQTEEPAPNVADTTGEFVPGANEQVVQITHVAGDSVNVENIEIILRASGPGDDLPTEARLIDFPSDGFFTRSIDETNVEGNEDLIEESFKSARIIVVEDADVWSAGKAIQFTIGVGGADFRDAAKGIDEEAEELEVVIVHTPSNSILSEHTFTP
jgi:FlaG/FlaF family flagellin (archaellin)